MVMFINNIHSNKAGHDLIYLPVVVIEETPSILLLTESYYW